MGKRNGSPCKPKFFHWCQRTLKHQNFIYFWVGNILAGLQLLSSQMDLSFDNRPETKTLHVKNLNMKGTALLLKEKLESLGYPVKEVHPGRIILADNGKWDEEKLAEILQPYGLDIIKNKDIILVEQIKQAVIELIHYMNNMNSVVRKSEYLVEKLGKSYSTLTRVFSAYEPVTLEKYIILQKIERIKELIDQDEMTLSEISYLMDYSSVQYLSNQFKKITGYSVTEYKNNSKSGKQYLEELTKKQRKEANTK